MKIAEKAWRHPNITGREQLAAGIGLAVISPSEPRRQSSSSGCPTAVNVRQSKPLDAARQVGNELKRRGVHWLWTDFIRAEGAFLDLHWGDDGDKHRGGSIVEIIDSPAMQNC